MRSALLAAIRDADDGAGLVAVLPVGGRTLIERQARLAVRAGATHVVVLVERVPAGLAAAVDRLRRDGVAVEVARSAGDAADRFHPDEHVLVFADGALAGETPVRRVADGAAPALLTLGEALPGGGFERIDAATRWAGIAMVGGDFLRRTVAMLGDWDLHSTLLRRAAAASARRIDVADRAGFGDPEPAMLVRSRAGARLATRTVLDRPPETQGWPARLLYAPLAGVALPLVLDRPVEARWLRGGALLLSVLAVAAAWLWPLSAALALAIVGALLDMVGRRLDAVRLGGGSASARFAVARALLLAAMLAAWAARSARVDAIPPLLAVGTIAAMAALAVERATLARLVAHAAPRWLADPDALVLLSLPFAVAGRPLAGLAVAIVYAAGSFAFVQRRLTRACQGLASR